MLIGFGVITTVPRRRRRVSRAHLRGSQAAAQLRHHRKGRRVMLFPSKTEEPDPMPRPDRRGAVQHLKNYLVSLGPEHWAVQLALRLAGRRQGWSVVFDENSIRMRRRDRELVLAKKEFIYVPMMFWYSEFYFDTMKPDRLEPHPVWDYSEPAFHLYQRSGLRFFLPALPEEDAMDTYTHWYKPAAGDVVWDVGAHAGVTTFFLSQLVGRTGRVYAWEPDDFNYECLLRNIAEHGLTNVVPIRKALDSKTGVAQFQMDGTMSCRNTRLSLLF